MIRPALLVVALALAGCSSHESGPTGTTTSGIVVSLEPAKLPEHLQANECFAAVRGFAIVAEAEGPTTLCRDLAARYLRGLHRLSWPPPLLSNPDGITECTLDLVTTRLAVMRTTTNDALGDLAYALADQMCSDLRTKGWIRAPSG